MEYTARKRWAGTNTSVITVVSYKQRFKRLYLDYMGEPISGLIVIKA
jgi:hypothetical protein